MNLETRIKKLEELGRQRWGAIATFQYKLNIDLYASDADPVEREKQEVGYRAYLQTAKNYENITKTTPMLITYTILPKCNWGCPDTTKRMYEALQLADTRLDAIHDEVGVPRESNLMTDTDKERVL
jgi:hypothetical protein